MMVSEPKRYSKQDLENAITLGCIERLVDDALNDPEIVYDDTPFSQGMLAMAQRVHDIVHGNRD
jgi:hypothetical protein